MPNQIKKNIFKFLKNEKNKTSFNYNNFLNKNNNLYIQTNNWLLFSTIENLQNGSFFTYFPLFYKEHRFLFLNMIYFETKSSNNCNETWNLP